MKFSFVKTIFYESLKYLPWWNKGILQFLEIEYWNLDKFTNIISFIRTYSAIFCSLVFFVLFFLYFKYFFSNYIAGNEACKELHHYSKLKVNHLFTIFELELVEIASKYHMFHSHECQYINVTLIFFSSNNGGLYFSCKLQVCTLR